MTQSERSDALLDLAVSVKTREDLLGQAVHLAELLLPDLEITYHTGADERPIEAGEVVPVRADDGWPLGRLHVVGPLESQDLVFVARLAEVLGACLARLDREAGLRHSERRFVEAQRISGVGSYDFEIATNTNTWSDQLYRIYGREPQSFMASYEVFLSMLHPDDVDHVLAVHQACLATLEPFEMEERVVWPNGEVRTLASWGEVVPDAEGNPARMVGICWDITERKAMEEQLVREALHDRLTGLPNRVLFVDRLTQSLSVLPRKATGLAVLFLDVDRFKVINDSLGHEAGDEVLLELSRRLAALMRPGDTVARFGGDEFVVLCHDIHSPSEAMQIAERLQHGITPPITTRESEVVLTVSIGISLAGTGADLPGDLLRDADAAMYRAKRDGRARALLFADSIRDEALARLETEVELRKALSSDDLRLHFQPVIDLSSGETVGVEALLRWQHPTRGLVMPQEIIPIAEDSGLIVPLGEWVLEQACQQLVAWQGGQTQRLTMAVNLSGLQISRPDFIERVADILARTGVDPTALYLEVTETVLMNDAEQALRVLLGLKALGVRISVDDFGTGYSSLTYLKRFPVDVLKIDRSFVDGLGSDPEDLAIVQATLALAQALGMSTVAEGIETDQQLEVLRRLGCTQGQGYLFSRPVPADELELLLTHGLPTAVVPAQAQSPEGSAAEPRKLVPARRHLGAEVKRGPRA
jgi:diguanylate cyclase (GGDEF)-like protein/PAS domain S-box-containing protein